jgi:entericidin B
MTFLPGDPRGTLGDAGAAVIPFQRRVVVPTRGVRNTAPRNGLSKHTNRHRRRPMVRRIVAAFAAGIFALAASACNTVEGFGEDVESVGEEIDEEI